MSLGKSMLPVLLLFVLTASSFLTAETAPVTKLPDATNGTLYFVQLGFQISGAFPFKISVAKDAILPHGLQLNDSGLLQGTPDVEKDADYSFNVTITDAVGKALQYAVTLHVIATKLTPKLVMLDNGAALTHAQISASNPAVVSNSAAVSNTVASASIPTSDGDKAGGSTDSAVKHCDDGKDQVAITLNALTGGDQIVSGTIPDKLENKKVRICIDGVESVRAVTVKGGLFAQTLSTALTAEQKVTAQVITSAEGVTPETFGKLSDAQKVATSGDYNWGRVRMTISGGTVFSQDQNQLSTAALYLAANVDSAWFMKIKQDSDISDSKDELWSKPWLPKQVNTNFDARLSSLSNTTCLTSSPTSTTACSSNISTFLSSQKAVILAGSLYLPYYTQWSTWSHGDLKSPYALYFAPLVQAGYQTILGSTVNSSNSTAKTITVGIADSSFYHFAAFGAQLGLFHFHLDEFGAAPERMLYLNLTYGKYQNYAQWNTTSSKWEHPYLLGVEGRFKVPHYPFFVGFESTTRPSTQNGNFKIYAGVVVDLGSTLQKLGIGVASSSTTSK